MTTSSSESLSHARWDGTYHVVFLPQGCKKALDGQRRPWLGPVVRAVAGQRGRTIVAGPRVQGQVHRRIRMPPKEAVAEVLGSRPGQRAIAGARPVRGRPSNWHGARFWARGSAVSTVGWEAVPRRASRKQQEHRDAPGAEEPGECSPRPS